MTKNNEHDISSKPVDNAKQTEVVDKEYIRDFARVVGRRIAKLRKSLKMNQTEFSQKAGIMINTVSNIERGQGNPQFDTLVKMASILNVPLTDLLDMNAPQPTSSSLSHRLSEAQKPEEFSGITRDVLETLASLNPEKMRIAGIQIAALANPEEFSTTQQIIEAKKNSNS
ncbi:MAG: helix-turn-helix transcriptional regulator [Alphaproteobacteria bacterium]|nr:helix-turn-helix transcriptional regulator [Alphaproteobacteria bacterium]MBQ8557317.1 helix-turn-helix transcriptional regulator [Alphaproteobacteria bacterium]